ncbi:hypothetical protein SAMN06296273_2698 [Nitrosomonas ureae]|uniref:YggT family protein n=1 Tax=Nitrosomonas ureae TaxID=44577 RepID=A0A285C0X9_9PROT|nr:hypothetical protein [Nitrosomonas ureae]SNX61247.1 hypothetical protein SAMN06296273_2698 [Nitrosomonas ureae]
MTTFETFLIPGHYALRIILSFLQIFEESIEPALLSVFAGFISWVFWMAVIRAVWAITLRIFGFGGRGHYR